MKYEKQIGTVTIGMYSPLNKHNVGIARMPVECAIDGVAMRVKNASGEIACKAHSLPFYDPQKKIRSAKG